MKPATKTSKASLRSWIAGLQFSRKLAVLSAAFVLPTLIAIVSMIYFVQQQVAFTQKERLGADVLQPLGDLALAVEGHSSAVQVGLIGEGQDSGDITKLEQRAATDVTAIDGWMATNGSSWGLADGWSKFKADWADLEQRDKDVRANAADHVRLAGQLVDMIGNVSDTSNITLDPEMGSYSLGDLVANNVPAVAVNYAAAEAASLTALQSGSFTPKGLDIVEFDSASRVKVANDDALGTDAVSRAASDVDKGGAAVPDILTTISGPLKKAEAAYSAYSGDLQDLESIGAAVSHDQRLLEIDQIRRSANAGLDALTALHQASDLGLSEQLQIRLNRLFRQQGSVVVGCLIIVVLAVLLVLMIARNLTRDVGQVAGAVSRVSQGDYDARAKLEGRDEIGQLARAFDNLLDERLAALQKATKENEQLNNSVVVLLQAVAQLSRRDLTVKVPVSEDVTGAVADALNQLTRETAKVLTDVSNISSDVTAASMKVKQQSDTVVEVAETGRQQVEKTAEELSGAATAMNDIARLAQVCNTAADNAIKTAQSALQIVTATVGGINSTRDTIRETEKRIKRLGERSQEISGAVNLINTIAERTHILALNASMHAASAGEAGRGFAVVAEEVQRLAESARQATAQIATLVNNIQVETADTVNTMNEAISQVVQGSKLAEQAGEEMKRTQETTADLVKSVQAIAASSQTQAKVSNQLLERAGEIRKVTQRTNQELIAQSEQTTNLVEYAKNLLGAVRVFKLTA